MRFKKIYIEITNICNLSCSFCPPLKRDPRTMSVAEFEHILKEVRPYTDYVYLHVKGEPLMHPQLAEILELCAAAGVFVQITTNGTLLPSVGELLVNSPAVRQVNISVHSMAHDDSAYLKNVTAFAKVASAAHKYIVFRLWNMDEQGKLNPQFDRVFAELCSAFGGVKFGAERRSTALGDRVFISREQEFTWPSPTLPFISDTGTCRGMRDMAAILCDGTVTPCCLDDGGVISLGNVLCEKFCDIIESSKAKEIYNGFCSHRVTEELCKRCVYRTRFDKDKK